MATRKVRSYKKKRSMRKTRKTRRRRGGEDPPPVESYEFLRAYHLGELGSRRPRSKVSSGGKRRRSTGRRRK